MMMMMMMINANSKADMDDSQKRLNVMGNTIVTQKRRSHWKFHCTKQLQGSVPSLIEPLISGIICQKI